MRDFSEKILPIDDDVDGTECIYDVTHFLWRAGGRVCGKHETDSRKVERKSVGDTAGKEKG